MIPYSLHPENPTKSCKSRDSNLHVHLRNTHETAQDMKGMHIRKATQYLSERYHFKEAMCPIPSIRWQSWQVCLGKQWGWSQGRCPKKSAEFLLHVLKTAESNAELKGLDVDSLAIEYIQVNEAPKIWSRKQNSWVD